MIPGLTIDGPTSLDLDDAVWITREGDRWVVTVTVTDVAVQVPVGSVRDQRARQQGATRYFCNGNAPMLPRWGADFRLRTRSPRGRPT